MTPESTLNRETSTETRLMEMLDRDTDLKTSLAALVRELAADVRSITQFHGLYVGEPLIPVKRNARYKLGPDPIDLRLDAFESKWGVSELFMEKERTGMPIEPFVVVSKIIGTLSKVASKRLARLLTSSAVEQRQALLHEWLKEMEKTFKGLTTIYEKEGKSLAFMGYMQNFSNLTMLEILDQMGGGQTEVDRTSEVMVGKIQEAI